MSDRHPPPLQWSIPPSSTDYAPFVPEVLGGFDLKPASCNITATRGHDGVLQMSYTLKWRADETCVAMAGLSLKHKSDSSRKSRSQKRQSRPRSRSTATRSAKSHSHRRESRASPSSRRSRSKVIVRKSEASPLLDVDERSFLGIPSPRANLLQMMGVTLVLIEPNGGIQRREAKQEMVSNESLYNCINDMLAALGTTLSSVNHTCPVRLFYQRVDRVRPISYEDFRKMHLNHFNAVDGTLTFILDLANSVEA